MKAPIKSSSDFAEVYSRITLMQNAPMYRLMLLLTEKLGLRPMELAGLETAWFGDNELRIPLGHSKRKQGRSLPINDEILAALALHMQGRVGRVFLNRAGQCFTPLGITKAVKRLYVEAGQRGSAYSGRRTLATRLVDEGANILVVQQVLGHSSPATTLHYCAVTPAMMHRALFA